MGWTVADAAAGELLGVYAYNLIMRKPGDRAALAAYAFVAVAAPIGATVAFNASRRAAPNPTGAGRGPTLVPIYVVPIRF